MMSNHQTITDLLSSPRLISEATMTIDKTYRLGTKSLVVWFGDPPITVDGMGVAKVALRDYEGRLLMPSKSIGAYVFDCITENEKGIRIHRQFYDSLVRQYKTGVKLYLKDHPELVKKLRMFNAVHNF